MTTTDTLKLYAALHASVPETRPSVTNPFGNTFILQPLKDDKWEWVSTDGGWNPCPELNEVNEDEAVAHSYRAALEWACKTALCNYSEMTKYSDVVRLIMQWYCDGASSDSHLIDICRAIHAAKGGGK